MEWDKPWPPLPACPVPLDDAERPIVVKMAATRLDSSRERIAGLRLLLESDPESGLNVLRGALGSERHMAVRALLRHLIGLYRDATTADVLRHYLDDPDAGVRAAAADAIGLIHCRRIPGLPCPQLLTVCWPACGGQIVTPGVVSACVQKAIRKGWPDGNATMELSGDEVSAESKNLDDDK